MKKLKQYQCMKALIDLAIKVRAGKATGTQVIDEMKKLEKEPLEEIQVSLAEGIAVLND